MVFTRKDGDFPASYVSWSRSVPKSWKCLQHFRFAQDFDLIPPWNFIDVSPPDQEDINKDDVRCKRCM